MVRFHIRIQLKPTHFCEALNVRNFPLRIRIPVAQAADILHAVRNILVDWTIDLEKQGILGENLLFSREDEKKSKAVTDKTVNTFNIGQVGAFAVASEHSRLSGVVNIDMQRSSQLNEALDNFVEIARNIKEIDDKKES